MDAEGKVTRQTYGNGVTTNTAFRPETGLVNAIGTSSPLGTNNIQDLTFTFDTIGNLIQRQDLQQNNTEDFTYDNLNRMVESDFNGSVKSYAYDALGNITSKTGIGSYSYGGTRPHALTSVAGHSVLYDANGNVTQNYNFTASQTRTITWSSYNKPTDIDQGSTHIAFKYGASRELFQQAVTNASNATEYRTYINPVFEVDGKPGKTTYIHYLKAGGQTIGLLKSINDFWGAGDSNQTRYLHRDHLGSITAITDETAQVVEQLSYDAHGKRRQPTWDDAVAQVFSSETNRCFTGHQYLDDVGLIHMGGRVYDSDLGRFLSPDPFIQQVGNQQNFNRYTYVLNNPLSYTDPSGFFFKSLFKAIGKLVKGVVKAVVGAVKAVLNNKVLRTIAAIGISFLPGGGYLALAAKGFGAGFVASGGDLKAGIIGALTGAAFHSIGDGAIGNFAKGIGGFGEQVFRVAAHGVVGGVSQAIRGGKFLAGFASAGFSQFLEQAKIYGKLGLSAPKNGLDYAKNAVVSAVVGGTASVLGGGKFKNGALTGAFSRLFNDLSEKAKRLLAIEGSTTGYRTGRTESYITKDWEVISVYGIENDFSLSWGLKLPKSDIETSVDLFSVSLVRRTWRQFRQKIGVVRLDHLQEDTNTLLYEPVRNGVPHFEYGVRGCVGSNGNGCDDVISINGHPLDANFNPTPGGKF